jgi:hypothetical protein
MFWIILLALGFLLTLDPQAGWELVSRILDRLQGGKPKN